MIILAFSVFNGLASLLIYINSKRLLYLKTCAFWVALTLNFLVQARAQNTEFDIIMSYGFTMVPLHLLALASLAFCDAKYPGRVFAGTSVLALGLTLVLAHTDLGFTAKAMPFAIGAALPLLYTVFCFVKWPKRHLTPLMGAHAFVLILLIIHSVNFAVFRMEPAAQLWGWPIAYGLYQIMAGLFPALISDFSHLEEKERLRSIIDERTADLVNANVRLEQLLQYKEFLAKTLTHDLSNPLAVIQGRLQLAARGIKDEAKFISDIGRMADRIEALVKQVKNFELVEQRLKSIEIESVNVLECVNEVRELFVERLGAKQILLVYDEAELANALVRVERASFVNSVLPNLISNAIKFSHPKAEIRISVKPGHETGVSVTIEDSGLGIEKTAIDRMFVFGQNRSRPGTSGEPGTGFGMPILRRLIEAYGGEVRVESRPERSDQPGWTKFELNLHGHVDSISRAG